MWVLQFVARRLFGIMAFMVVLALVITASTDSSNHVPPNFSVNVLNRVASDTSVGHEAVEEPETNQHTTILPVGTANTASNVVHSPSGTAFPQNSSSPPSTTSAPPAYDPTPPASSAPCKLCPLPVAETDSESFTCSAACTPPPSPTPVPEPTPTPIRGCNPCIADTVHPHMVCPMYYCMAE